MKNWKKRVVTVLAGIVVFATTYSLILPAITIDHDRAEEEPGIVLAQDGAPEESAPYEEPVYEEPVYEAPVNEEPAAESPVYEEAAQAETAAEPETDAPAEATEAQSAPQPAEEAPAENGAESGPQETETSGQDAPAEPETDAPAEEAPAEAEDYPAVDASVDEVEHEETVDPESEAEENYVPQGDPTADVETAADWEAMFEDLELSDVWAEDLLTVARTQLGYTESTLNYIVNDAGDVKGYTRYGAWYGIPYGDWCAMFISFCLEYAGVPADEMPRAAGCGVWRDALRSMDRWAWAEDGYMPVPGDVVFFTFHGSGSADHVGIVSDVWRNESGVWRVSVIEGNSSNRVQVVTYDLDSENILGYGILPDNFPAQSFYAETGDVNVSVEADHGAFPRGTSMTVTPVYDDSILSAASDAVNGVVDRIAAVDITFRDEDGYEIEPRIPIRVSLTSDIVAEAEADDDATATVVHIDSEGDTEVMQPADVSSAEDEVVFDADAFSVYAIVMTSIEKTIQAGDGNTYRITMTYGESAAIPADAELEAEEITPEDAAYAAYLAEAAELLGRETGDVSYAKLLDITIVSGGQPVQPADGTTVQVSIQLLDQASAGEDTQIVHFGEETEVLDNTVDGDTVSFEAGSFSVYAIVDAPEPAARSGWNKVATVEQIAQLGSQGFYMRSFGGFYFKNGTYSPGGTRTGITKTNPAAANADAADGAVKYYFELVEGTENKFRVYCYDGATRNYIRQSGNSLTLTAGLQEDTVDATSTFTIDAFPNYDNTFRMLGVNGFYWNMQGGNTGNGFCAYANATDDNARIQLEFYAAQDDDPYDLDGKTFGIAYNDNNVTAASLTAEGKTVSGKQRLGGLDLLMRPDALTNSGLLLVAQDSDITEWTFVSVSEDLYYIKTTVDGATKYLTINGSEVTLEDTPDPICSVIMAVPGTGANSGKWHFIVNGYSLNFSGSDANDFNAATGTGVNTWQNLVVKSPLTEDDFNLYTARKVSVSDEKSVYYRSKQDRSTVVIYTRIWNDTQKRYEFYAVDHDGSLLRVYESGDVIQWVGTAVNTALWDFTEYFNKDGTRNYYYELQNTYSHRYIAPQVTGGQILSSGTIGINLLGRRDELDYSKIVAWDDDNYAYVGLKTENGRIVACPLEEAEDFYFAIVSVNESSDPDDELTTVATVNNADYGITMKMIDFNNGNIGSAGSPRDSLQNPFFGGDNNNPGLLSTDLVDGYPTTTAITGNAGHSLSELFTGMTDVNHLFIQSIYNESGYFEYNSTQNFAHLEDNGNFTVYDQIGTIGDYNTATGAHGQFMPYDDLTPGKFATFTNRTNVLQAELPDTDPRKGERLYDIGEKNEVDYQFGMEMQATFTQTVSGLDAWGHDIIFEFSGDDDFWLYVDDELVLDLGGVHAAMTGSVNFRTGDVKGRNGNTTTLYDVFRANYIARGLSSEEIAQKLDSIFTVNSDGQHVFKNYTKHTMKIFYMERGAGASNLKMRFNLASVKPGTVMLSKKLTGAASQSNALAEFPFQIRYLAQEYETVNGLVVPRFADEAKTQPITTEHLLVPNDENGVRVVYANSKKAVTFYGEGDDKFVTADGIPYEDVFILKAGETVEIDFPDNTMYYAIVECGVNTEVYNWVKVNDGDIPVTEGKRTPLDPNPAYHENAVDMDIVSAGDYEQAPNRKDYGINYERVSERHEVTYYNNIPPEAMRTLSFTKRLYDLNGVDRLHYPADSTVFSFRLYLGSENASIDEIPLANMFSYYVKDPSDRYCMWNAAAQKFEPLPSEKTDFDQLTDEEKRAATFTTSMNGSISKIPADYTVEVRDLLVTTKYKVEERGYEVPKGYTLRGGDGYTRIDLGSEQQQMLDDVSQPYTDVIRKEELTDPWIEVRNQKGWGLTMEKIWTDQDFMESHDDIFFAVYVDTDTEYGENRGEVPYQDKNTVRRLSAEDSEVYYYFDDLRDHGYTYDYPNFHVYEVKLTGDYTVDDDGYVTGYETITPIREGETTTVGGTPMGGTHQNGYVYDVNYETGAMVRNVRTDTVTNSRPGIELYKSEWDDSRTGGALVNPLAGAVFTLKDEDGRDVAAADYTSGSDGLITIAYLSQGTYTLTETATLRRYVGLPAPIIVQVNPDKSLVFTLAHDGVTDTVTMDADGVTAGTSSYFSVSASATMTATVTIKNRTGSLQVVKVDGTTNAVLPDTHFALYRQVEDADGSLRPYFTPLEGYEDIVTDANGILHEISLDLPPDTYYLRETQSNSTYGLLANDLCFTVGADGTFTINSAGHGSWLTTVTVGGATDYKVTIPNGMLELTIEKKDDHGRGLSGAVFKLEKAVGSTWENVDQGGITNGVIDMSHYPTAAILGLEDGFYRLTETKAPDGYIILANRIYFKIEGGTVTLTDAAGTGENENSLVTVSGATITVTNTPGAELPRSGGMGTGAFAVIGGGMAGLGILGLLRRRRRDDA